MPADIFNLITIKGIPTPGQLAVGLELTTFPSWVLHTTSYATAS